jgi:hypothetical protein
MVNRSSRSHRGVVVQQSRDGRSVTRRSRAVREEEEEEEASYPSRHPESRRRRRDDEESSQSEEDDYPSSRHVNESREDDYFEGLIPILIVC